MQVQARIARSLDEFFASKSFMQRVLSCFRLLCSILRQLPQKMRRELEMGIASNSIVVWWENVNYNFM